ncbi:TPA: hypothetical protein RCG95_000093 [Enterobacter roggenkampii]|nr:hypothetical protein [Enterobacter roggenkampii]
MSVKRYEFELYHCNGGEMLVSDTGDYVSYDDYAALEARCLELAAENAGLKQFPDQIVGFIGKLGSSEIGSETKEKIEAAAKKIKTPATDGFLGEVRAQGVDSAINTVIAMMNHQHPVTSKAIDILRVHAYQIRKGVQS